VRAKTIERNLLKVLFATAVLGLALVPIITVLYSYDRRSLVGSGAGFILLFAIAGFFWATHRRFN
jgi:hypothetical protein